jgi:uncharacterized membrane protein YgcG
VGKVAQDAVWDISGGAISNVIKGNIGKTLPLEDILPGASALAQINPEYKTGYAEVDKTKGGKILSNAYQMAQEVATTGAAFKLLTMPLRTMQAIRPLAGFPGIMEAGRTGVPGSSLLNLGLKAVGKVAPYALGAYSAAQLQGAIRDSKSETEPLNVTLNSPPAPPASAPPAPPPNTPPTPGSNPQTTNNTTNNNTYNTPGSEDSGTDGLTKAFLAGVASGAGRAVGQIPFPIFSGGGSSGGGGSKAKEQYATGGSTLTPVATKKKKKKKIANKTKENRAATRGISKVRKGKRTDAPGAPTQSMSK